VGEVDKNYFWRRLKIRIKQHEFKKNASGSALPKNSIWYLLNIENTSTNPTCNFTSFLFDLKLPKLQAVQGLSGTT
jgi:hypothetical protein